MLGSTGIVTIVAYFVLHLGASLALFCGLLVAALRLSLPWGMNRLASRLEADLRQVRRITIPTSE
jgi:hypothetical protein